MMLKKNKKNNNKEINYYSLLTCLNYIDDEQTLINLTKTCKKYSDILELCRTNLTPNYKLFKNATVYTFYNTHFKEYNIGWYFGIKNKNKCKFPIVLPKYKRYNIQEILHTNLFYQLFRNNSKFHFKSIIYTEYLDLNNKSRYYCDLNDINMVYIDHLHRTNLEYVSNKIETLYIRSYAGTIDLRKCEKLKHVYTYMDYRFSGPILLPKHLKELIVIHCENMYLYDYDIEILIIYGGYSPCSFPKKLKHLIIYNAYSSYFTIDTKCKIPDTLEDILFIDYYKNGKYLIIQKGRYSKVYVESTLCKSITIGNTIINDDDLSIGLFNGEILNKVKKLNEEWS